MGKRIILDPGHGGLDPGAVGNGLVEKRLTWELANMVQSALAPYDVESIIIQPSAHNPKSTADDEVNLVVAEANRLHKEIPVDLFLSIHINAGGGTGFESFVHPRAKNRTDDRLRGKLHDQVMEYLKQYNLRDRGKKYENFGVLRMTDMPAVLLECLFIDSQDTQHLRSNAFLSALANEIAYGLVVALELQPRKVNAVTEMHQTIAKVEQVCRMAKGVQDVQQLRQYMQDICSLTSKYMIS